MNYRSSILSAVFFTVFLSACGSDDSSNADVSGAKSFVADARTWNYTIQNEVNGGAANPTEFKTRVDIANATFNAVGDVLSTGMSVALKAAADAYLTNSPVDLSAYSSVTPPVNAAGSATISGNTVTVEGTVESMNSAATPVLETATIKLTFIFPASKTGTQFVASIEGTSTGGGATLSIDTGSSATLNYAASTDLTAWLQDPTISANLPTYESATMNLSATLAESLSGTVTDPIGFTGSFALTMVSVKEADNSFHLDSTGNPTFAVEHVKLAGDFGNSSIKFNATLEATAPNASTFIMPADGVETADMYRQIKDATISFSATLDGLPTAKFAITFNRITFEGAIAQVEIAYGVKKVTFIVEQLPNNGARVTISVTDGVNTLTLVTSSSSPTGTVYYNGSEIGTISDDGNGGAIITYVDGSIESLQ